MTSLNEELRRVNDIKGWKVLGDKKQQPQGDVKVSLDLWVPTFKHISSQVQRFWRNCIMSMSVKLTTPKNNLKGTLKALMFCSGSDETCLLTVKRVYVERGPEFLWSTG